MQGGKTNAEKRCRTKTGYYVRSGVQQQSAY